MRIEDGICARLTGGLGNQLFVLAAAWQQSVRLDCPLYIDASRYISGDLREFELGGLDLPGTVLFEDSPWYAPPLGRLSRNLSKVCRKRSRLHVYRETSFGYQGEIDQIRPGTTLMGYFQSPKYFHSIVGDMYTMLGSAPASNSELSVLGEIAAEDHITVHMRRGDFVQPNTMAFHGIATTAYFQRALRLFERVMPGVKSLVFSDSLAIAREELREEDGLAFFDDKGALSSISTLKAMSMARGFVMSNSSFSWWAAWLMTRTHSGPVVAPRPWLAAGEGASDLLLPEWLTLGAR